MKQLLHIIWEEMYIYIKKKYILRNLIYMYKVYIVYKYKWMLRAQYFSLSQKSVLASTQADIDAVVLEEQKL